MQNVLTRKNIGMGLAALLGVALLASAASKITGGATEELASNNIGDWTLIIGLGELASLVFFLIPRTMRFGALLLSAYFGGAIMFHMTHTDPLKQSFMGPTVFLVVIWVIAWLRGLELFEQ
ncbi:MAG: DoxX family protein [Bacteroidota bacterium]